MKALTLHQPWASFMAIGLKTIETRGRRCHIRERVAICAGKAFHREQLAYHINQIGRDLYNSNPKAYLEWLTTTKENSYNAPDAAVFPYNFIGILPLGAVVATADIVDCQPTKKLVDDINSIERTLGNYAPGRYGWIMDNIKPLETPVPIIGKQGFFNIPDIEGAT